MQQQWLMGRYQLLEVIGRGGMGTVYRALDTVLERQVAIKFFNRDELQDPGFVERFFREARATARLQHPNIIQVYDMGHENSNYYMIMELLEGTTLKDLIIERAPLPVEEAVQITIEILRGLGEAHRVGVIHRDIKPQNILRSLRGTWKLADFGIAHMSSATKKLTRTGVMFGSVQYFSPEQARGEAVANGSDLYAVGIMLYEMLTGQLPFDADEGIAIAIKHIQEPVPDPRKIRPDLPDSICQILFKAVEKDLSKRYQSATEMMADLFSLIKDETEISIANENTDGSYFSEDQTPSYNVSSRFQHTQKIQNQNRSKTEGGDTSSENRRDESQPMKTKKKRRKKPLVGILVLISIAVGISWYQLSGSSDSANLSANNSPQAFDLTGLSIPSGEEEENEDKVENQVKKLWKKSKNNEFQGTFTRQIKIFSTQDPKELNEEFDVDVKGAKNFQVTNRNDQHTFSQFKKSCVSGKVSDDNITESTSIPCGDQRMLEADAIANADEALLIQMKKDIEHVKLYKQDKNGIILFYNNSSLKEIWGLISKQMKKEAITDEEQYEKGLYQVQLHFDRKNNLQKIIRLIKLKNESEDGPHIIIEEILVVS